MHLYEFHDVIDFSVNSVSDFLDFPEGSSLDFTFARIGTREGIGRFLSNPQGFRAQPVPTSTGAIQDTRPA